MTTVAFPDHLTLEWLQGSYASGRVTPAVVMEEIIRRAETDAAMNIWITPPTVEALAPYLEGLAALDPVEAPLWGIPFAVKDNIDVAGLPTTAGCAAFSYRPEEHAAVVERLVNAGAIPIGKTNLDQFATGLVGTRSPYGETHNALRPELISGGSSSGSAVAVARGQAVFSLGTDTAGSGRVPAALNGLVGYKPSVGSWPLQGVVPACASLDCVTVFAHSLGEALLVDHAVRGAHEGDPWSREFTKAEAKRPAKLCLPKESVAFYGPFAAEYEAAWLAALERVKQLNIPIEYVDYELFADAAELLYGGPLVAERWADLGEFIEAHPGAATAVTEQVLRTGALPEYDAASLFRAMHKLQEYKRQAKQLLRDAVLIMPTCGGTWTREQVRAEPYRANSDMGRYTNHCNLLDLCAVAIPSDAAGASLPFGITLFALAENEHLIEAGARAFLQEPARNGADRRADDKITVAVCGLHMRGYPLEKQMLALRARFVREASSAPRYRLVKLPTSPAKPGMIKQAQGGATVALELWEMPLAAFGALTSSIPAPLGIGKVELMDGSEVSGFVCEAYAAEEAEDITAYGGWRNLPQS
ncbi:allophanate hydrolase [Paenibacillus paridis]|uniref:allophanate hydrolase n=1 Tax=Paenibacillus paridis TaxID=2583376 RepID=UPI00111E0E5C|nr:allophanate hydrolase [Paenibacillus paridis]